MLDSRLVLGVTGIRSEYDIMSSVYAAICGHPALKLKLIVTGAHLSPMYGYTVQEIRKDGFEIADEVESLIAGDRDSTRVKGLAVQLAGIVQTAARARPAFLLVLGDREEAMSTALAGAYMNIPVAHVAGGDRVVGNVDDQVRHAVSRLAHLHFVTNQESHDRLVRMGEQPFRVLNVGNPGLDRLLSVPDLSVAELSARLGLALAEGEPFLIVIQHVISTEIDHAYSQMKQTLEAVRRLALKTVVIYPNSDAGSQEIIRCIREYESVPFVRAARHLARVDFVNLMRRAACLVGNSSAGILEAPLLRLPVVNVGNRQRGRLHAENVQFVPHDFEAICGAVRRAIYDEAHRQEVARCCNPYGDGHASVKIAETLATVAIDEKLLVKDVTY